MQLDIQSLEVRAFADGFRQVNPYGQVSLRPCHLVLYDLPGIRMRWRFFQFERVREIQWEILHDAVDPLQFGRWIGEETIRDYNRALRVPCQLDRTCYGDGPGLRPLSPKNSAKFSFDFAVF